VTWVNHYLAATYRDGGRGPYEYDCFGLTREVLNERCGWPLMPAFGALRHSDPKGMTVAQRDTVASMRICDPAHGVLACVFRGVLMVHVAVIIELDGALAALEINPKQGARWSRIPDFERQYLRVVYYDGR
jgi:hypothetical protein